eukprot:scaffold5366_cov128-Isochrysis_galbana.AAC.5
MLTRASQSSPQPRGLIPQAEAASLRCGGARRMLPIERDYYWTPLIVLGWCSTIAAIQLRFAAQRMHN